MDIRLQPVDGVSSWTDGGCLTCGAVTYGASKHYAPSDCLTPPEDQRSADYYVWCSNVDCFYYHGECVGDMEYPPDWAAHDVKHGGTWTPGMTKESMMTEDSFYYRICMWPPPVGTMQRSTIMSEAPTETPTPDAPETDVPEPVPPVPVPPPEEEGEEEGGEKEPASAVEPRPSLGEFVTLVTIGTPARAALQRWMIQHGLDPSGNYPLSEWRTHLAACMAST
jgi:hypothetical protein